MRERRGDRPAAKVARALAVIGRGARASSVSSPPRGLPHPARPRSPARPAGDAASPPHPSSRCRASALALPKGSAGRSASAFLTDGRSGRRARRAAPRTIHRFSYPSRGREQLLHGSIPRRGKRPRFGAPARRCGAGPRPRPPLRARRSPPPSGPQSRARAQGRAKACEPASPAPLTRLSPRATRRRISGASPRYPRQAP